MNNEKVILNANAQQEGGLKHRIIMLNRARKSLHGTTSDCPTWEAKHRVAREWSGKYYQYKADLMEKLSE